ncbi:MAG: hypothetical protein Q8O92_14540 [Candidatus Latescibacter sp.]|nr:hypothetical protein [Candidatus Latescibacter sp.]
MERFSAGAIDTLAIFKRLKKAGLPEEAAREIAMIIKEVFETNKVTRFELEQVKVRY